MFFKLRDKFKRLKFGFSCRGILSTAPVKADLNSPLALMTQLQHKDVLMAIIAFKSFTVDLPVGAFFILNDGSLTDGDMDLLRHHFPGVKFLRMADAYSELCPKGGCWERLLSISQLVKEHYVIQLDSDTLTLGDIPEIAECVKENRSFVIGTWNNQEIESMPSRQGTAAALVAKSSQKPHIQMAAESGFDKLSRFNELKYVRGCAGFSGFAKDSFDRAFVEEISVQMTYALGNRWREWGSEQVMSNIVVANTPNAQVLPHPKYCDCTKIKKGDTVFIHFIGSCRFTGGVYAGLAREATARLERSQRL
jgi:hypothetical protein